MGDLYLLGKMDSAELLKEIEFWGDQPPSVVCRHLSFGSLNYDEIEDDGTQRHSSSPGPSSPSPLNGPLIPSSLIFFLRVLRLIPRRCAART
jgi:hypothetical protein